MFKSQIKKEPSEKQLKECSNLMIPCLNCEQLFLLDEVDDHSKLCSKVTNRVQLISQSNQIFEEVNFKISRLRDSLLQLIGQNRKNEQINSDKKVKFLRRISDIAESLISIQAIGGKEQIQMKDLEEELRILNKMNSSSVGITIHIDRLQQLLVQKMSILRNKQQRQEISFLKPRIASLGFNESQKLKYSVQNKISQPQNNSKQNIQKLIEQKKGELQVIRNSLQNIQEKIIKEKNSLNLNQNQGETFQNSIEQNQYNYERNLTQPENYFYSPSFSKNSNQSQRSLFNISTDKGFSRNISQTPKMLAFSESENNMMRRNSPRDSLFQQQDSNLQNIYFNQMKDAQSVKEYTEKKNNNHDLKRQVFEKHQWKQYFTIDSIQQKNQKKTPQNQRLPFSVQNRSEF